MCNNSKGYGPLRLVISEVRTNLCFPVFHPWAACFIILQVLEVKLVLDPHLTLISPHIPGSYS